MAQMMEIYAKCYKHDRYLYSFGPKLMNAYWCLKLTCEAYYKRSDTRAF